MAKQQKQRTARLRELLPYVGDNPDLRAQLAAKVIAAASPEMKEAKELVAQSMTDFWLKNIDDKPMSPDEAEGLMLAYTSRLIGELCSKPRQRVAP
jgi:hypothetical protein